MKKLLLKILICCAVFAAGCSSEDEQDLSLVEPSNTKVIGVDPIYRLEISDVFYSYVEDHQTRSIWEALTGEEFTHGYLVMRSQPDSREGMYFTVMLPWEVSAISIGSIIELEVDSNMTAKTRLFTFKVQETSSTIREIKLGLTGLDWKGKNENVNAWRIAIKTPAGNIVAQKQSWLWALRHE